MMIFLSFLLLCLQFLYWVFVLFLDLRLGLWLLCIFRRFYLLRGMLLLLLVIILLLSLRGFCFRLGKKRWGFTRFFLFLGCFRLQIMCMFIEMLRKQRVLVNFRFWNCFMFRKRRRCKRKMGWIINKNQRFLLNEKY